MLSKKVEVIFKVKCEDLFFEEEKVLFFELPSKFLLFNGKSIMKREDTMYYFSNIMDFVDILYDFTKIDIVLKYDDDSYAGIFTCEKIKKIFGKDNLKINYTSWDDLDVKLLE